MDLIQLTLNPQAVAQHMLTTNASHSARHDRSYALKTALAEAFGGMAIRPWSLISPTQVLGYSTLTADELTQRLSLAAPSARPIVTQVLGYEVPPLPERLRISVTFVPTVRVTGIGERDAFTVARKKDPEATRVGAYLDYFAKRLRGAEVEQATAEGYRSERITRKSREGWHSFTIPVAMLTAVVRIHDESAFRQQLMSGIGRQRAYGFGCLRLAPVAVARNAA